MSTNKKPDDMANLSRAKLHELLATLSSGARGFLEYLDGDESHRMELGTDSHMQPKTVRAICLQLRRLGWEADADRLWSAFLDLSQRRLDIAYCNAARLMTPEEFEETLSQFLPFPLPQDNDELHEQIQRDRVQILHERVQAFATIADELAQVLAKNREEKQTSSRRSRRSQRPAGLSDKHELLLSILTEHHGYRSSQRNRAEPSITNYDPMKSNDLARLAEVSNSTSSEFFKKHFKGYRGYVTSCRNGKLLYTLSALNGDFSSTKFLDELLQAKAAKTEDPSE